MTTPDPMNMLEQVQKMQANMQAKVLQREKLGAATSGLDLGSLGRGGLDGLLG